MDYLNENEKQILKKIIDNPVAVEAIKKVLLADIYGAGIIEKDVSFQPRKNWVYGILMNEAGQDYKIKNDEIGEKVRAVVEGTRALELAFKELEKLKDPAVVINTEENQAR